MRRVLLLEEDATYAAEIRRGLARLGMDVVLIRDGSVGLARAVSERFDLMLVSAELPAVNGFRLCNRVKKDPSAGEVPIFLMGNIEEELKMHRQLPTRADDYFKKPVVLAELVARMRLRGVADGESEVTVNESEARISHAAVEELQAKLVEQETKITTLNRELAQARAKTTRFDAQAKEVERLRRALDEARAKRARDAAEEASAENLGALKALEQQHGAALTSLEKRLEEHKVAADGFRVKLAAAEGETQALRARARDQEQLLAAQKKHLDTTVAERSSARKEVENLNAELVRVRAAHEALDVDVKGSITTRDERIARISELEKELAEVRKQNDEADLKRRELTRALSDLSRRVAGAADERAKLAKRAADAESVSARLEADLATSRKAATLSEALESEREAVEGRLADLARQVTERERVIADLDARLLAAAELRAETERDLETKESRIREIELRASAATEASQAQDAAGTRRQLAELEAKWQGRLVAAVNEAKQAAHASHDAELDALLERFVHVEHDRAEIQAGFEQSLRDLEASMERTRGELEDERQAHRTTRAAHAQKVDALNTVLAGRNQTMVALERDAEQARGEITELEAEIVVLRSELVSVRRELEAARIGVRARDVEGDTRRSGS